MNEEGSFVASMICASPRAYASGIVDRQMQVQPNAPEVYGSGYSDLTADTEVRLGYLSEALATGRPALLHEQLSWLKVICAARNVPLDLVRVNLECTRDQLLDMLPPECTDYAANMMQGAIDHFDTAPTEIPSFLEADAPHIDLARRFLLAVLEAREEDAKSLVLDAFSAGVPIRDLHQQVLRKVQGEVGRMWQMGEVSIAEEHYCSEIVTATTTLLASRMTRAEPNGKIAIAASVCNDLHSIGIRIVGQDLEMNGWKVLFLGANTPAIALAETVRDFGADLIALSVSIVLHVRRTAEVIESLRTNPMCQDIPILVGGHPFNLVDDLWQVIGADGCANGSADASEVGARLVGL